MYTPFHGKKVTYYIKFKLLYKFRLKVFFFIIVYIIKT